MRRGDATRWNESGTASVVVIRPMLTYARSVGVDVDAILGEIGVPTHALGEYDRRISEANRCKAWILAGDQARVPAFGIRCVEHAAIGAYDVLDYSLSFSSTVGEALDRLLRFHRILCDAWALELGKSGGVGRLRRIEKTPSYEAEAGFAFLVTRSRALSGRDPAIREVRFAHAAPDDIEPHRAFFRAPVHFGRSTTEMFFDASDLALPVRTANPGVVQILDRYMTELLARLPKDDSFVERVRGAVARTLLTGRPTLAAIARELHASARTVQRRLSEHGTSHLQIIDSVRRETAERLVAEGRMSITEIAFLLGFADVSGFRRVYKRWTGVPPSRERPHPRNLA